MTGPEIILIILVLIIGFYMLWNIGANDVANAIGTSVGSKALTLKRAIIIAAVLEFFGAFILGSNVTETIQSGIISPDNFLSSPMTFVLGMLASLSATAICLQIATHFKKPVSTTHAIIGALLGFGILIGGPKSVEWGVVGSIVLSWIISPGASALIAFLFFSLLQQKILFARKPAVAAKRIAPFLVFIVLFTFVISLGTNGLKNLHIEISLLFILIIAIIIGLIGGLFAHSLYRRANTKIAPQTSLRSTSQLYALQKASKQLARAQLASDGPIHDEVTELLDRAQNLTKKVKRKSTTKKSISMDYQIVEKMFASLQILTACFVAFAHGANDVANAIGPVGAIIEIIRHPSTIANSTAIPLWLLIFGGTGIVIGLATYGWRVIETIGKGMTQLTPTRGFCAEFAAATTILIASKLGLPISTTHCIVGGVIGVGMARGLASLNFIVIRNIFLSWVVTIPSAAITSILLYYILAAIFGSFIL